MEISELINLFTNNGIGIACVIYLIYFQSTTMKDMSKTLNTICTTLENLTSRIENIENKL